MKIGHKLVFIIIVFWLLNGTYAAAQPAYEIKISIAGQTDSVYFLANYFGDKYYIADTSVGQRGVAIFKGNVDLKQGIYILANNKKERLVEILIGPEKFFSISLKADMDPSTASIKGSKDNELFFMNLAKTNEAFQSIQTANSILESLDKFSPKSIKLKARIDSINSSLSQFRLNIIRTHPELFFSKILLAMQEPEIPAELQSNQTAAYQFYKKNFWATFDLTDDRLLLTPILPRKLESYFSQLVLPMPDSVIFEMNLLLSQTKGNQKMFDYLAWHFFTEYQNPKIMGLDKVFVYLADQYFVQGKVGNVTPSILEKITERSNKMRNSLVGMQAPDLRLIDSIGNYRSFHELKSDFIVLIFWDQTCSHCKNEMQTLDSLYQTKKDLFQVFAINTTGDLNGWKQYVREKKYPWLHVNGTRSQTPDFHDLYDIYSTPVIYILDKSRKIVGKRISASQVDSFLKNSAK